MGRLLASLFGFRPRAATRAEQKIGLDFIIPEFGLDVKSDYHDEANMFLEYATEDGKPFGLMKGEARVFIYYFVMTGGVWWINADELRHFIAGHIHKYKVWVRRSNGGRPWAVLGAPVPIADIQKHVSMIRLQLPEGAA